MALLHRRFRPGRWPTLAVALLFPALLSLGFWQLQRAEEKALLHGQFLERSRAAPLPAAEAGAALFDADAMHWRRLRFRGRFEPPQFLLDNQVHEGAPGYFVFTPFQPQDMDARLLVNRGWVPAGADRARAPAIETPAETVDLVGTAKPFPVTPVLAETPPEVLAPGVVRLQQVDGERIAARYGWRLLPYALRLDGEAPGFVRDWQVPGSGRERHLGYAFQWFAMAAALLVIYIAVNLRRTGPG